MSLPNPIGGFFELELSRGTFPHHEATLLASGRNCFEYILRASSFTHVYLPRYTCDAMFEPLTKLGISYTLYAIDTALEVAELPQLGAGECLVYNNYFGFKTDYANRLAAQYGAQFILDNSQAFFAAPPAGCHAFYSPRKFFGVPDGGLLYSPSQLDEPLDRATSYGRSAHLLRRIDEGPEAAYQDYQANEAELSGAPLRAMSRLTQRLLEGIDYETARHRRQDNFEYLHHHLASTNGFTAFPDKAEAPMVYPYLAPNADLRAKLIAHKVFVATYWPNVLEASSHGDLEHELALRLIPLPIDQRYSRDDMKRIVELIGDRK